jgi:uncharacterized protein (TIGR03083 family)
MDHLSALADLQAQFLETTRRADPATPVPWLGRWTVEKLVVHLARIHHWAAGQARRKQETRLGRGPFDLPALYAECAAELRETLAALDPDAPAWTLLDDGVPTAERTGPGAGSTVRFWHRRQAHETLVHLWDLRVAIGEDVDAPPERWLDCLHEVVTVMHPRQVRLERLAPPSAAIAFQPGGADASLRLAGAPDGAEAVTIAGPSKALALLAWGRLPLDAPGIAVDGDRSLAAAVLEHGLTP